MLRVLGEVDVVEDGVPAAIGSQLQRTLLAALALDRGQVVSTDRLAERVWGDQLPANPAGSLQSHVSRLRRNLPAEVQIVTVGDGYRLDVADDGLDVALFEQRSRQAHDADLPARLSLIDGALELWRGPPFGDLDDPGALAEAARLEETRQSLAELRAESLVETGRLHEAMADLENLRVQHPLRERPVELLMRAYVAAGRKSDSLRVYQELRTRLRDELGLDPAPELRALEEAILREEIEVDRSPSHADAGARRPAAITLPASPFLGREAELAGVAELLRRHRIVTLTGPGGVGKTRLAIHVAHGVRSDFADGTWLIELASVRDTGQIPDVVATALGVRQLSDVDPLDRIVDHIGERRALIVLDNVEHVVEQAARFVHALVVGAPGVSVLATGREALNIDGERVWRLDPLPVDITDPEDAALRLFEERAAAALPGFHLDDSTREEVAHVCRRLDGLPLAIELAAARLATLSLEEVVVGLDERFDVFNRGRRTADERHRSLRAVVDWSCRQLGPAQLEMFARLSVFAGRCTARAAERVCGPSSDRTPTADVLADLVERSLLVEHREPGSPTRYGYLETIRAHAADRLAARGETEAVRDRHARWAMELAETMNRQLFGPGEIDATRRLTAELPELRVAHHHLMEVGDADGAIRLSAALRDFATLRMHSEAFGWAVAVADRFSTVDHELTETVLASASTGSWQAGDNAASRRYAESSREASTRRSEPGAGRAAAEAMGDVLLFEGHPEGSLASFLDAIDLCREGLDRWGEASCLCSAAICAGYVGDTDQARSLAADCRRLLGPSPSPTLQAWIDYAEGEALAETEPDRALELLARALEGAELAGARFITGVAGLTHVSLLARRGDQAALPDVLELIEHWREGGVWTQQWITMRMVVDLLAQRGDHEGAAVLLGALEASARSSEVFGADAERLDKARAVVSAAIGDRLDDLLMEGAALDDLESVHYAVDRVERLIG